MSTTFDIVELTQGVTVVSGVEDREVALEELRRLNAEALTFTSKETPAVGHFGEPRKYEIVVNVDEPEQDEIVIDVPDEEFVVKTPDDKQTLLATNNDSEFRNFVADRFLLREEVIVWGADEEKTAAYVEEAEQMAVNLITARAELEQQVADRERDRTTELKRSSQEYDEAAAIEAAAIDDARAKADEELEAALKAQAAGEKK